MEIHHSKHHATYVTNLNKALEQYAEAEAKHDLQKMISLQSAINFNGGGALPVTHSTWRNMHVASPAPAADWGHACPRSSCSEG
jgi:Fe-Mn family superoxide dismutase